MKYYTIQELQTLTKTQLLKIFKSWYMKLPLNKIDCVECGKERFSYNNVIYCCRCYTNQVKKYDKENLINQILSYQDLDNQRLGIWNRK